jgi:hypothetical protein
MPFRLTLALKLKWLQLFVKWISLYLVGANFIPWRLAQPRHLDCPAFRILQLPLVKWLKASILTSFVKPIANSPSLGCWHRFSSFKL